MTYPNPDALARQLFPYFYSRGDRILTFSDAISQMQMLSGLRGLWSTSAFGPSGEMFDFSNNVPVRTLTKSGSSQYNYDQNGQVPYIDLTGGYFYRADEPGLSITGTESDVDSTIRGISLGGWFWFDDALPAATEYLIAKDDTTGGDRSYILFRHTDGHIYFRLYDNANTAYNTKITTTVPAQSTWHYCAATANITNQTTAGQVDGETNTGVTGTEIKNTGVDFTIGAAAGGTRLLDGRASLCRLNAVDLGAGMLNALYQSQKHFFGVE